MAHFERNWGGSGTGLDPAHFLEHPVKRFFILAYECFWRLVFSNLLFLLFALPIVTIPASFAGLLNAVFPLAEDKPGSIWENFKKGFISCFWRAELLGLLAFIGLAIGGTAVYYYFELSKTTWLGMFPLALALGCVLLFCMACNSAFTMLVKVKLTWKGILKNALLFSLSLLGRNLIALGAELCLLLFTVLLFPGGILYGLFMGFSFTAFVNCYLYVLPIQRYVLQTAP